MSFEILRVTKVDDYDYDDANTIGGLVMPMPPMKRRAYVVHCEVQFKEKRTFKQWWNNENAREWVETVQYFTETGHDWKDFPSLRRTNPMEWKKLTDLFHQFQIKHSLRKRS